MALTVDGETRVYFTVGDPIGQAKSPALLSQILAGWGRKILVIPAHVAAADFGPFMKLARAMKNLSGFLITVPHKRSALACCDSLSERARAVGAVNLIRRMPGDEFHGDNLDGLGLTSAVSRNGFAVGGSRVLLIGAGGAGATIAYEVMAAGARELAIHDADENRLAKLVSDLQRRFPGKVSRGYPDASGFDLVVNATPMGMKPDDPPPFRRESLTKGIFVADLITKPDVSALIQHARNLGCGTMTGKEMFEAQAEQLARLIAEQDDAVSR